jgi:hypothetical protein
MRFEMVNNAVARQTEMDALDPSPEPIGMADRNKKDTFAWDGFDIERYK